MYVIDSTAISSAVIKKNNKKKKIYEYNDFNVEHFLKFDVGMILLNTYFHYKI